MNRIVSIAAAIAVALVGGFGFSGSSARAATVLVDFGNNSSFRGASVTNPDQNGNNWNSMQPGLFYTNLIDTTGTGPASTSVSAPRSAPTASTARRG